MATDQGQKVKDQDDKVSLVTYQQQERYNWAPDGSINFQLGENYHHMG